MKKIMFNDTFQLTEAVLEGRKTQTRRIVTPQPTYDESVGICWKGYAYGINFSGKEGAYKNFVSGTEYNKSCKRYRVGEVVAIAESYKDIACSALVSDFLSIYGKYPWEMSGWINKMFVRSEWMPHQILITNVRIQRLHDISDEDCLKEGVVVNEPKIKGGAKSYYPCQYMEKCADKIGWGRVYSTPREAYADLIDKVSGKGTWESNPYVFVYDFELVK